MPNLYCDNYAACNEVLVDRGTVDYTVARARAAGWHIFDGTTIGGAEHHGVLGPKCLGRKAMPVPKVLEGQEGLFEV